MSQSIVQEVCNPLGSTVVHKSVAGSGYPRCYSGWCTTEVSLESSLIVECVSCYLDLAFELVSDHSKSLDCCCSVSKLCPTLYDTMDYSPPRSPVLHYLLVFTEIHVYWVSDSIKPSHPLLPPSPIAFGLSQHQGLFQ